MAQTIEEILGVQVERERAVPGTRPGEAAKVRYVSFSGSKGPADVYEDVVWKIAPPIAQQGGVVLEGCIITSPVGDQFYALSFHGDVAGWQTQIESGAAELGLLSAKVETDDLTISDGRTYGLSDCTIVFD